MPFLWVQKAYWYMSIFYAYLYKLYLSALYFLERILLPILKITPIAKKEVFMWHISFRTEEVFLLRLGKGSFLAIKEVIAGEGKGWRGSEVIAEEATPHSAPLAKFPGLTRGVEILWTPIYTPSPLLGSFYPGRTPQSLEDYTPSQTFVHAGT